MVPFLVVALSVLIGCLETNSSSSGTPSSRALLNDERYAEIVGDISNPDRGVFKQLGDDDRRFVASDFTRQRRDVLDRTASVSTLEQGASVVRLFFDISDFRSRPLDASYLNYVERVFAYARSAGKTVIPRWTYFIPRAADYEEPNDVCENYCVDESVTARVADIELIETHISQIAPILNRNADVISFVEMGMLGHWGEWHGGPSGNPFDDRLSPNRQRVVAQWLLETNSNVFFALRYPRDRKQSGRLQGVDRVGLHHDCPNYISDTYPSERFIARIAPQGGEMCQVASRTDYGCATMISYFERFRFDVLHASNWTGSHTRFANEGCLSEIRNRLGYRFVIRGSNYENGRLTIAIENTGFGKSYKNRLLSVSADGRSVPTGINVRNWEPGTLNTVTVDLGEICSDTVELVIQDGIKFANTTGNTVFLDQL